MAVSLDANQDPAKCTDPYVGQEWRPCAHIPRQEVSHSSPNRIQINLHTSVDSFCDWAQPEQVVLAL